MAEIHDYAAAGDDFDRKGSDEHDGDADSRPCAVEGRHLRTQRHPRRKCVRVERCDARTATGICDHVLDELGYCGHERSHA